MFRKDNKGKFEKLRRLAEEMIQQDTSLTLDVPIDLGELIHELEVHQIELGMQHKELERAYAELEKARQVYANLFDFAPIGYIILDRNGVIQNSNLTLATMLGIERRNLIEREFALFIDDAFKDVHHIHQRMLFQTGSQQSYSVFIRGRTEPGFFAYVTSEIDDADAKTCRVSVTDITRVSELTQLIHDINGLEDQPRVQLDTKPRLSTETVTWDKKLFRRILLNLLQNALKYSEGEVQCEVNCKPDSVSFAIKDHGMGIPAKDQAYIYDMFYRGGNTVSVSGTGVGLGIVKLAVEAHQGHIRFETNATGTTFFITLPRHVTDDHDES